MIMCQMFGGLRHDDIIEIDEEALEAVYAAHGHASGDRVICKAIEDIAVRIAKVERHVSRGKFESISCIVDDIKKMSPEIGLRTLAQVATDVDILLERSDNAALIACVHRMVRVGEKSLLAVWDVEDAIS